MGAWGAGIFSDHTAADVRNIYGELIRNGLDGVIATEKLLMQFAESLDDPDDGPPFWLGLAAVRYRLGRLEERVRDRAVRLIDDGTDLRRFSENPELARTRERITAKLRTHLIGPSVIALGFALSPNRRATGEIGEIVGIRRASGEWLPLHVQASCRTVGGQIPWSLP